MDDMTDDMRKDCRFTPWFGLEDEPTRDGLYNVRMLRKTDDGLVELNHRRALWKWSAGWLLVGGWPLPDGAFVRAWRGLTADSYIRLMGEKIDALQTCLDAAQHNARLASDRLAIVDRRLQTLQDGAMFVLRKLEAMRDAAPAWQKEGIERSIDEMKAKLWPTAPT